MMISLASGQARQAVRLIESVTLEKRGVEDEGESAYIDFEDVLTFVQESPVMLGLS